MKISTKGRYALRMMLEFALHPGECTKINQVAERQQISDKYLEQIVTILSRAGYVKSMRGAQGGYYLTKEPADYTVGMILRLTEQLDQAINGVVDSITLADLVEEQKKLDGDSYDS